MSQVKEYVLKNKYQNSCWNADEDTLKCSIEKNKFVKDIRKELARKKYSKFFKS